jgi:hypothetical protein
VTLDTREANKDNKVSHTVRPGMSKSSDKKRKHDRSVTNVERPHHNRTESHPQPDEYESFLDGICISTVKENTRLKTEIGCKDLLMKSSNRPKRLNKKRR